MENVFDHILETVVWLEPVFGKVSVTDTVVETMLKTVFETVMEIVVEADGDCLRP